MDKKKLKEIILVFPDREEKEKAKKIYDFHLINYADIPAQNKIYLPVTQNHLAFLRLLKNEGVKFSTTETREPTEISAWGIPYSEFSLDEGRFLGC